MVAPVTGPIVTYPSYPFADAFQRKFRQKPPYNLALEYEMYYVFGRSVHSTQSGTTITKTTDFDLWNDAEAVKKLTHCSNKAYEQLKAALGPSAGWAENIAQIGKTRSMIIQRAVQLASVASSVRKGRFGDAARMLRTPVPSGVSNRKAAAQNFLEFEYGWKPLAKDLVDSVERLNSFPDVLVPLRGKAQDHISRVSSTRSSGSGFSSSSSTTVSGVVGVQMGAMARITNPNLFLANQLGVIDFALPWKLIPFSFVVDWFVNVEQVISSVSDWYGVQLLTPYTTRYAQGSRRYVANQSFWTPSTGVVYAFSSTSQSQTSVHMRRDPAISMPALTVKPFKGFSIERAAQAVSLVLSVLGK
jgi:hypothetical protein